MRSRQNNYTLTPVDEEKFFRQNPDLAKALEALRDKQRWQKMEETRLEIERLVKEVGRILDS